MFLLIRDKTINQMSQKGQTHSKWYKIFNVCLTIFGGSAWKD